MLDPKVFAQADQPKIAWPKIVASFLRKPHRSLHRAQRLKRRWQVYAQLFEPCLQDVGIEARVVGYQLGDAEHLTVL